MKQTNGPKLGREISMSQMKGTATNPLIEIIGERVRRSVPVRMLELGAMEIIDPKIST